MGMNIGYMTSDRTVKGDELYTPSYAVEAILPYIPDDTKTIWCPFDTEDSQYVKILSKKYDVINTHIEYDQNFFEIPYPPCDCIISNPPFSKKEEILKYLFKLDIPFAIMWPLPSIQLQKSFNLIKQCELLIFNKRIRFHHNLDLSDKPKSPAFASIYLCKNFLSDKLIFAELL